MERAREISLAVGRAVAIGAPMPLGGMVGSALCEQEEAKVALAPSFEAAGDDPTPNCARATTLRLAAEEKVGDGEQPLQPARALSCASSPADVASSRMSAIAAAAQSSRCSRGTSESAHAGERVHSATASAPMADGHPPVPVLVGRRRRRHRWTRARLGSGGFRARRVAVTVRRRGGAVCVSARSTGLNLRVVRRLVGVGREAGGGFGRGVRTAGTFVSYSQN